MYEVYLKKGEERRLIEGHSWIYANEVQRIDSKGKNGEIANVYNQQGQYVGKGFINHLSKILVRLITRGSEEIDRAFFISRIAKAKALREQLGYDNNYRAVFAEADGLPALIVDKYGDLLSVQFLSLGMDMNKSIIIEALVEVYQPRGIYERSDVGVREKEGLKPVKGIIYGEFDPRIEIIENGLKLLVDIENGQKTGYFLDQKENRYAIRRYCRGKSVLDCFSNVGGFALNAAAGGASDVTALDISELAVATINDNAARNNLSITAKAVDVFDELRNYRRNGVKFDVIVLDPPAFCKTADQAKAAYAGYKDININALKIINSGGFLVTCSCSHHMSTVTFEQMLTEAARDSRRTVRLLERRVQSPDHPIALGAGETSYLKVFILHVE